MIRLDVAEPTPLEIDPNRTALLVIDMQNTWWKEGGTFLMIGIDVSGTEPTFAAIDRTVEAARGHGIPVIWVNTVHERDQSTAGPPSSPWRKKEAALAFYSADPGCVDRLPFRNAWGAEIIEDLSPGAGDRFGCTNVCLGDTLRDGYRLGYHCVIVDDASRACGPPSSQGAELANITHCYGWSVSSEALIDGLG